MFLQTEYRIEDAGPRPVQDSFHAQHKYAIEIKLFTEFYANAAQKERAEEEARKKLYAAVFGEVRALAADAMSALQMGDENNLRKALMALLDATAP